ncbi:MAG: MFS transporter [Betaproteobacteria bacterium]|nr:MAG: MFS transporter [Betaproteobacteria bacterium]
MHRNVALLAACQAMLLAVNSTLIAINGLAGLALAPAASLATLPVTCWVIGGALTTAPASLYMKRVGRREGLLHGVAAGIIGVLICGAAVYVQSFWLLCAGTLAMGGSNAFGQYYRFAAADAASPAFRPTAISLVLAGGLVGGILGPATSRITVDALGPRFMGAYLALIGFILIAILLLRATRLPEPPAAHAGAGGRPLGAIARQPKFVVAVLCGAISYGVMNFLMTSTPLAMGACGHPYGEAAFVIAAHVVGMFAPSFFTGTLVARLGVLPVMFAGAVLKVAAIAVALAGVAVAHFLCALVLLGVGWNFLYIGATTLLTETYRSEERALAQGANESAIFAMMAISSFISGLTVAGAGWERVNLGALPLVGVMLAALAWLAWRTRVRPGTAAA